METVSSIKVCWVAEASVYTFMFVMYTEIVHVQCYRGWYVETGYTNTIFGKLPYPHEKAPMGGAPYIGFKLGGGRTFA